MEFHGDASQEQKRYHLATGSRKLMYCKISSVKESEDLPQDWLRKLGKMELRSRLFEIGRVYGVTWQFCSPLYPHGA